MPKRYQVWFYRGSPAAKLLKPLRGRYTLRPLPRSGPAARRAGLSAKPGVPVVCVADLERDDLAALRRFAASHPDARLVVIVGDTSRRRNGPTDSAVFVCVPRTIPAALLERTVVAAFETITLAARERAAREDLARTEREMEELNRIGVALSSTRDINQLLELILRKSREITRADAGSLYLVEEVSETERRLRFKLTQNDSAQFPFKELTMPITEQSMAGYVALHGEVINLPDAYKIPPDRPYHFNPKIDQASGYRTRSMVTLPMKNAKGEILGVLQLINSKKDWKTLLTSSSVVQREVQPFSSRAVQLALSLASQAAVAYENSKLYEDIETLFEGFVKAAVTAIEQRDPTTSGHSFRVSSLTVGLAECVDRADAGPYADMKFTREQMKEIRYAALLHDFGKVGVREEVLVKARKLYPLQLDLVAQRFDYIKKELEARTAQQKMEYLLERDREEALEKLNLLDEEYKRQLAEVDDFFQFILRVNEPTVLPEGQFDYLIDVAKHAYRDPRGIEHNFLLPHEVRFLSIPKGSLDQDERLQIESHVVHTFNFLNQIPWTKEIKDIPAIARAHHEKLSGRGYPYKLTAKDIPFQSRMMAICDVFDALSASDRPYKRAVPVERALDILRMGVRDSEFEPTLLDLFIDAKIYQLTTRR
jgi:HD-GYP domain-containing protein (c-di-GMP phosphodiesterase class II)